MRVLIIKTSDLGQIIHALPLLDYLKRASSTVEIDWVVEEQFREVLEGNPLLSELHTVRTPVWRSPFSPQSWREAAQLKETLRAREYDFVFDIQGDLGSGVISWLTGGADRIGFQKSELQESLNSLFAMRRIPLRRQDSHFSDRCLRLVSVPFARNFQEMQLSCSVNTSPEDEANAEALLATLSDGLVFLFHYGANTPTGLWSEKSWISLGQAVLDRFRDASILFTWESEEERDAVGKIAQGVGLGARVLDRHSLKGLAALLKRVDLVVGGDAPIVPLAAALAVPTVSFYRAGDGRRSGPRGERHVVIQSPMHCTRCLRNHCDKDTPCRDTIKVETVFNGVQKLLEGAV